MLTSFQVKNTGEKTINIRLPFPTTFWQCFPQNHTLIVAVAVQLGCHRALTLTESANFRFGVKLTWMGIKCNRAALLDSLNIIGPNRPNSDCKTTNYTGFARRLLPYYRLVFNNVSFFEKLNVITRLGHDKKFALRPGALCGGNEASCLLCWGSYSQANCKK